MAKDYGCKKGNPILKLDPEKVEIVTDPEHALFNAEGNARIVTAEDIANYEKLGQLDPILVLFEGSQDEPRILAVDGRFRLKVFREINRRRKNAGKPALEIDALPYEGSDPQGAMYAANWVRAGDDVVTKARHVQRYLDSSHTPEETMVVFRVTRTTMNNLRRMATKASPALKQAVESGAFPAAMAYKATLLSEAEQEALVRKVAAVPVEEAAEPPNGNAREGSEPPKKEETSKPPRGRALAREVDKARGKKTPSQRLRTVKELQAMRERAERAHMPASAMAIFDWMLGEDDAREFVGHRQS